MSEIDHIFFDIGGVLGSNGWDREQRNRAVERFHLDADDFQWRHEDVVGEWEEGRITLDEYLDIAVFYTDRQFTRSAFIRFMLDQSVPHSDTVAVAQCEPSRSLFIDDRQQNLTPARSMGMNVILYQSAPQLRADLEDFLQLKLSGV